MSALLRSAKREASLVYSHNKAAPVLEKTHLLPGITLDVTDQADQSDITNRLITLRTDN